MKLANTLALVIASTLIWNCNEATKPDANSEVNNKVPATVEALTKQAALAAGYEIAVESPDQSSEFFGPEAFEAFAEAGLCENFVKLIQELIESGKQGEGAPVSARLQNVQKCLGEKAQKFSTVEPTETEMANLFTECFCDGSAGGLFLGNFTYSKYRAPVNAGLNGYVAPQLAPSYSAPTLPSYQAPGTPGGAGYQAPSL